MDNGWTVRGWSAASPVARLLRHAVVMHASRRASDMTTVSASWSGRVRSVRASEPLAGRRRLRTEQAAHLFRSAGEWPGGLFMRHALTLGWFAICLSCGIGAVGCSRDSCFPETIGHDYRVRVVERWDSESRFPGWAARTSWCPTGLEVQPGSTFVVRINDANTTSETCFCGRGPVLQSPEGWTWTADESASHCGANFYYLLGNAAGATCTSSISIDIGASRVPTGPAEAGKAPTASMDLVYSPIDPDTCGACSDSYVVEIESL